MKVLTFGHGEIIFRQGTFGKSMFDIVCGKVGIYVDYGTADEKLIAEMGEGEIFGEMGLIEVYPRSATAVALEDGTNVAEITLEEYGEYFEKYPEKIFVCL